MRAAINVQSLAGDKRGRLQVKHCLDNFLNLANSPQRVQAGKEGVCFLEFPQY